MATVINGSTHVIYIRTRNNSAVSFKFGATNHAFRFTPEWNEFRLTDEEIESVRRQLVLLEWKFENPTAKTENTKKSVIREFKLEKEAIEIKIGMEEAIPLLPVPSDASFSNSVPINAMSDDVKIASAEYHDEQIFITGHSKGITKVAVMIGGWRHYITVSVTQNDQPKKPEVPIVKEEEPKIELPTVEEQKEIVEQESEDETDEQ